MRILTWNVNGLRACLGKGFLEFCKKEEPEIICIQETKMQVGQTEVSLEGYEQFWNSAEKKGYSGTAIFTRQKPISVNYNIDSEGHDKEGRAITLEFETFYIVTVYTPNAQEKLARLDYRMAWENEFRTYVKKLDEKKPVIICGDLNVAHQEIDLKNPKSNKGNAGFSDEERQKFTELLEAGFIDTYRYLYPEKTGAYTWWSYRFNARANNAGWRIDYFLASERIKDKIRDVTIYDHIMGSDHCPVLLDVDFHYE
ncbi:exodeoxyribonuclease III [Sinanaerobacter chloroacetimidivorans]|jgi:exodeoxyribonuclease-3|uniref:Exodeoxyribonuclease III n=1 Tax=Sinanaerobacter chloroacetimidivorans TaxID=2818044 RepID=A0A8J7W038_9FIRM|nr:exodeoxyribonuclease III [Sinanaerobacter chloroacetimidivorans]MBR0596731.1 exodeoxyribonuclease III [Sinanaerobacter chloroacetimidivorans]